jgi:hypothetical protein
MPPLSLTDVAEEMPPGVCTMPRKLALRGSGESPRGGAVLVSTVAAICNLGAVMSVVGIEDGVVSGVTTSNHLALKRRAGDHAMMNVSTKSDVL